MKNRSGWVASLKSRNSILTYLCMQKISEFYNKAKKLKSKFNYNENKSFFKKRKKCLENLNLKEKSLEFLARGVKGTIVRNA